MKSFRSLKPLRALLSVSTGFVAGAMVESRYPFMANVEGRAKDLFKGRHEKTTSRVIEEPSVVVEQSPRPALDLPYLTDKLFETTDDMLVFMFPSEEVYKSQTNRVMAIADIIRSHQAQGHLSKVKLFFTIVPVRGDSKTTVVDESTVEIMCYKGQRKQRISVKSEDSVSMESLEKFFAFKSTPVEEELKTCVIEHIAGDEFEDKVLNSSSKSKPVLVQLYEKSCFLCFLMRPFLNSLATVLSSDPAIPFTIKRLDIEENDFPDHLPVVRGTPTFVLFRGKEAERLEEFKPRDLVRRIVHDYPVSKETETKLYELVDKMTLRFQSFSGLVMWNTESEKILELISGDVGHNPTIPFDLKNSEDKDKEIFNRLVSEYMGDDMLKIDTLDENLKSLSKELTQMEKHAIMMGQVLGEKVLDKEIV